MKKKNRNPDKKLKKNRNGKRNEIFKIITVKRNCQQKNTVKRMLDLK